MAKKSKLPLILGGALVVIVIAVGGAFMVGQKSPLYAAGTIRITKELEPAAKGMRTLYIVALPADGGRMPLGAARFTVKDDAQGDFVRFALTPETMTMMPGAMRRAMGESATGNDANGNDTSGMPGKFTVKARLDADGAGGMDQPGDLVGVATDVTLGSREVAITIDQAVR